MVHIPLLLFSFSYLRPSLLPQDYSCTYQRVPESARTLLNCQCNVFLPCIAITTAAFLKKTATIETTVVSDCMMVIQNIVS